MMALEASGYTLFVLVPTIPCECEAMQKAELQLLRQVHVAPGRVGDLGAWSVSGFRSPGDASPLDGVALQDHHVIHSFRGNGSRSSMVNCSRWMLSASAHTSVCVVPGG